MKIKLLTWQETGRLSAAIVWKEVCVSDGFPESQREEPLRVCVNGVHEHGVTGVNTHARVIGVKPGAGWVYTCKYDGKRG